MILAAHIIIAITSVIYTGIIAFNPSKTRLQISYVLAGATLSSGTLLVLVEPKTLTQACTSGLIYFACIAVLLAYVRKKVAVQDLA